MDTHTEHRLQDQIEEHLANRGLFGPVRFAREVDSTNAWARRELGEVLPPATFIAEHQTAGRGRLGRSWLDSPAESVLLTVMLSAPSEARRSLVPLLASLAAAEAIEAVAPELNVFLKWPNDLHVHGRKCGGILVEQVSAMPGPVVLIGIGINVNAADLPADLLHPATSLAIEAGRTLDRASLYSALIHNVCLEIDRLSNAPGLDRLDDFRSRMTMRGDRVRLFTTADHQAIEGVLLGIDDSGGIRLATDDGIRTFHAGDLTTHDPQNS